MVKKKNIKKNTKKKNLTVKGKRWNHFKSIMAQRNFCKKQKNECKKKYDSCLQKYKCKSNIKTFADVAKYLFKSGDLPSNPKTPYELKQTDIQKLDELGHGEYGKVLLGKYKNKYVAIKEPNNNDNNEEFLKEALISAQFNHEHVIKIIGIVTKIVPYNLVLEYCSKGSLKTLIDNNNLQESLRIRFGKHIALGMHHLASKKFVHRDLAARNILVNENNIAKVADFGLTREYNDSDYYQLINNINLPLRWLSPECLDESKFSEKSDIWAFGVTIIEIYIPNQYPYKNMNNSQMMNFIKNGNIHEKPQQMSLGLYNNLKEYCFHFEQTQRKKFKDIVDNLTNFFSRRNSSSTSTPTRARTTSSTSNSNVTVQSHTSNNRNSISNTPGQMVRQPQRQSMFYGVTQRPPKKKSESKKPLFYGVTQRPPKKKSGSKKSLFYGVTQRPPKKKSGSK